MDWTEATVMARSPNGQFAIARPSLVMGAFGDYKANRSGSAMLDWWLAAIPEVTQLSYIGANAHTFRDLTPRVLQRIRKALQKEEEESHFYMLKDAPDFDCGNYAAEFKLGVEPDDESVNMMYCAFPRTRADGAGADSFIQQFTQLVDTIPIRHAFAGLGFNLVFGREYEQGAMPLILTMGRRYMGLDVRDRNLESTMADRVKSAAWLTYLHQELVEKLGGQNRLKDVITETVDKIRTAHGLILRASRLPPMGDRNRGAKDAEALRQIDAFLGRLERNRGFPLISSEQILPPPISGLADWKTPSEGSLAI